MSVEDRLTAVEQELERLKSEQARTASSPPLAAAIEAALNRVGHSDAVVRDSELLPGGLAVVEVQRRAHLGWFVYVAVVDTEKAAILYFRGYSCTGFVG